MALRTATVGDARTSLLGQVPGAVQTTQAERAQRCTPSVRDEGSEAIGPESVGSDEGSSDVAIETPGTINVVLTMK